MFPSILGYCAERANCKYWNKPVLLSIYLILAKSSPDFYRNNRESGMPIITILKEEESQYYTLLLDTTRDTVPPH